MPLCRTALEGTPERSLLRHITDYRKESHARSQWSNDKILPTREGEGSTKINDDE